MEQEQKKFEEVTLYNFVSLRSPQNREKGDEDIKIDFIFCDVVESKKDIQNVVDAQEFDSYEAILKHPEIRRTIEAGKILNEYKYKEINFYRIHKNLSNLDFDEGCIKEIMQITWKALVKLTKIGGELKFKEALINILRIFHIEKHIKLISNPEYKEDIPFFNRLINAQVVIPQELLPKADTFFFGEKLKQFQINPYAKERAKNNLDIARTSFEIANLNLGSVIENEKNEELVNYKAQNIFLRKTEDSQYDIYKTPIYCSVIINNNKGAILLGFNDLFFKESKVIKSAKVMVLDNDYPFGISDVNNPKSTTEIIFELNEEACLGIIQKELDNLTVSGFIKSIDESVYEYEIKVFRQENKNKESNTILFYGEGELLIDDGTDFYGNAFAPSGYGIKQLGISEYRKVVSTISRYVPAEVAKIENVMASEYREMATIKELTKEVTDFESTESSKETETESVSTDRFQMQNEIAKIFATENTGKFDTKASYGADSTKLEISYGTSTKDSKNESNRQAVTNAKEVTNKAVEKIFTKVRKERTVKVTEKFTESNKHGFDNRGNANHVSGVYRHINAVYKNQIYNYGRRLMYEFAIPEPALFHKLAILEDDTLFELIKEIPKPYPLNDRLKNHSDINENNYLELEKLYENVNLIKYPKVIEILERQFIISGKRQYEYTAKGVDDKIDIPKYFYPYAYEVTTNIEFTYDKGCFLKLFLGNKEHVLAYKPNSGSGGDHVYPIIPETLIDSCVQDFITYYAVGKNTETSTINIKITCKINEPEIEQWQKDNYAILLKKYEEEDAKYVKKLKNILEENPIVSKLDETDKEYIQQICLRKQCISYLISDEPQNSHRRMGQDMFVENSRNSIRTLKVNMNHVLNEYTAFARFLEQAFDWNMMSYSYYPFYWAKDTEWKLMYNLYDGDPDFKKFLQAGMARVIVSVKPGFEKAVMQYMLTGKIWEGGEIPTYGSSLFLSIAAEINENPEYKIEKTWETILPTNLIALQSSGVAINQEGLPNLEKSQDLGEMADNPHKFPKRKKFLGLF